MTPLERDAVRAAMRNIHADDEDASLSYERGMQILAWLAAPSSANRVVRLRQLVSGGPLMKIASEETVSVFEAAAEAEGRRKDT